jgi:SAM-dependent methyltransferase
MNRRRPGLGRRRAFADGAGRMKKLIARIVFALDRRMPRVRVEGRESNGAYSLWEYRTGKELLERYAGIIGPLDQKLVLDVGCGLGGKTLAYAEAGARVVGVDLSPAFVSRSRAFTEAREAPSPSFVAGDARRLPFADGSIDTIIANDSLEHFADPLVALMEFERTLRPGGVLALFFTPWGSPLGSHLYDYIRTPWCHFLFPEWLIRELLVRALAAAGESDPRERMRELMHEYHTELNRITVAGYHRILKRARRLSVVHEERRPPKYHAIAPLTRIPFIGELFTGTVVSILAKRRSA